MIVTFVIWHPAILSRAEAAKEEILAFWLRCEAAERL